MNVACTAEGWDFKVEPQTKRQSREIKDARNRCEYVYDKTPSTKEAYEVTVLKYVGRSLNACDVVHEWRELRKKVEPYVVRFFGGAAIVGAEETSELENVFNGLVTTWREETGACSLTYRRYAHKAYQSILTLGKEVVPLILRELQHRPDRWFEALKVLTKDSPAATANSFDEAVERWLTWGKSQRLI